MHEMSLGLLNGVRCDTANKYIGNGLFSLLRPAHPHCGAIARSERTPPPVQTCSSTLYSSAREWSAIAKLDQSE